MDNLKEYESLDNVFFFKTVQTSVFKSLTTVIKDILRETNITFTPEGITILNTDVSLNVMVHLVLNSDKFEIYICKVPEIVISVDVHILHQLINTIEANDTLSMYIENRDYNGKLISHLTLKYENLNTRQYKIYRLKLGEPDENNIVCPTYIKTQSIITVPYQKFQKIIRDIKGISDHVIIQLVANELIFKSNGPTVETKIVCQEPCENNIKNEEDNNDNTTIVTNTYSLKNLISFIKCTNISPTVEIYMDNDLPLIIVYHLANLGELKLCLAPIIST